MPETTEKVEVSDSLPYLNDMLIRAVKSGDFFRVVLLLRLGIDVNHVGVTRDETPLTIAMSRGNLEMIQLLVEENADVYKVCGHGLAPDNMHLFDMCPMTIAAKNDDVAKLVILLKNACNWAQNAVFKHSIEVARWHNSSNVLHILLTHPHCAELMRCAIQTHDPVIVEHLCLLGFDLTHIFEDCDQSPLALALFVKRNREFSVDKLSFEVCDDDLSVIRTLLKYGACCNEHILIDDAFGYDTFMQDIILFNQIDCFKLFMENGLDIRVMKYFESGGMIFSESAMECACRLGKVHFVKLMLDASPISGIDINWVYPFGQTALACSINAVEPRVVAYLIERGATYSSELELARHLDMDDDIDISNVDDTFTAKYPHVTTMVELIQTCVLQRIQRRRATRQVCKGICTYVAKRRMKRNLMRVKTLRSASSFAGICSGYNESTMSLIVEHLTSLKAAPKVL